MMRTWEDLRRLLAVLEQEWDVAGIRGDGMGDRQTLTVTFKRKPEEAK